jgi:hypothetical protein
MTQNFASSIHFSIETFISTSKSSSSRPNSSSNLTWNSCDHGIVTRFFHFYYHYYFCFTFSTIAISIYNLQPLFSEPFVWNYVKNNCKSCEERENKQPIPILINLILLLLLYFFAQRYHREYCLWYALNTASLVNYCMYIMNSL